MNKFLFYAIALKYLLKRLIYAERNLLSMERLLSGSPIFVPSTRDENLALTVGEGDGD